MGVMVDIMEMHVFDSKGRRGNLFIEFIYQ